MKSFYLILALLFYGSSSFAQAKAEEKLIKKITLALRIKNDSTLYQCLPSFNDFKRLVEAYKPSSAEEIPDAATIHKSITKEALRTFRETLDTGQKKGVDWSSIEIVKYKIEEDTENKEPFRKADIYITYKERTHLFEIKLVDCIIVNDEWKLMDRLWWYKSL